MLAYVNENKCTLFAQTSISAVIYTCASVDSVSDAVVMLFVRGKPSSNELVTRAEGPCEQYRHNALENQ